MAKLASGKKSVAISDRSGFKIKYTDLKTTWDGLRVEPSEWEPKHPQLTPAKNVVDATALFQPRPDNDPENVSIFYGYSTQDIFASRVERSQKGVGIVGLGSIGFPDTIRADMKVDATGVSGTGAIGLEVVELEINETGIAGTGAIGSELAETEANPSGQAGTGAIGDFIVSDNEDVVVTGATGTGAIGTFTFFITTDAPVSGVNGTGAIGVETPESEINETGVAGTGATEAFGVSGNGNILLQVTGVTGIGATGTVGEEIGVSEAIETGIAGTGAIGTTSITIDYSSWGDVTWGDGTWGE
jgi:hypothetical protein